MGKYEVAAAVKPWGGIARGVAVGALSAIFLLGICAVLVTVAVIPEHWVSACVLAACAVGTLVGGRFALSAAGKRNVVLGLGVGMLTAALLGVSGFLLYGELELQRCLAVGCACACGGGAAGVFGRRVTKKRRA